MIYSLGKEGKPLIFMDLENFIIHSLTCSGSRGFCVSTNTVSVCPSITGTLVQVQLTFIFEEVIEPFLRLPKIFFVSTCTFSSSFGIKGITLSIISRAATPGDRPAPDRACIDVMKIELIP